MTQRKTKRPECFGDLDTVFPLGEDGLRHSPETCLECPHKTDCLRTGLKGKAGLKVHQEHVDRSYDSGMIGFMERWSKNKAISRHENGQGPSKRLCLKILMGLLSGVILILAIVFREAIWENAVYLYELLVDRDRIRDFIVSFGWGAPLVFMGFQILQVIFAPVPGEATGFIGGYLFGVLEGFLYSSTALAAGSWINFSIGRFLGVRFVRKMIPAEKFEKFDSMLKRQGVIVLFLLFVFPGFPKDYLCLFLGLSTLPLKVFLLLAALGRMPGTLLLSLQGAYLFEENYLLLGVTAGACAILVFIIYWNRERIYQWVEKFNNK
jgi:uncharacterized membrane protein YdjX (TVP38/TMEM64 family)